jgi:hypothetical protein
LNAKKRISPYEGTSAFSSWFHPNSTCNFAKTRSLLVSAIGDKTVPLTAAKIDRRDQRHGYKGVISHPKTGEACSLHFSLWTAREGNHVFGQCLIYVICTILYIVYLKIKGGNKYILSFLTLSPAKVIEK